MKKCLVLVLISCGLLQIEALPPSFQSSAQEQENHIEIKRISESKSEKSPARYIHIASNEGKDENSFEENRTYNVELQLHRHPNHKEDIIKDESHASSVEYVPPNHTDKDHHTYEDFDEKEYEKAKSDKPCKPCQKEKKPVEKVKETDVHIKKEKCFHDKKDDTAQHLRVETKKPKQKKEDQNSNQSDNVKTLETLNAKGIKMKIRITRELPNSEIDRATRETEPPHDVYEIYSSGHRHSDGAVSDQKDLLDIHTYAKRELPPKNPPKEPPVNSSTFGKRDTDYHEHHFKTHDKKKDQDDQMAKESSHVHFHNVHTKSHSQKHSKSDSKGDSTEKPEVTKTTEMKSTVETVTVDAPKPKKTHNCNNQSKNSRQIEDLANNTKVFHVSGNYTLKQYLNKLRAFFKLRQKNFLDSFNKSDIPPMNARVEKKNRRKAIKKIIVVNEDGDEVVIMPPASKEIDTEDKKENNLRKILDTKTKLQLDQDGNFNISFNPKNSTSTTEPKQINITSKTAPMEREKEKEVKEKVKEVSVFPRTETKIEITTSSIMNTLIPNNNNTKSTLPTTKKPKDKTTQGQEFDLRDRIDTSESKSVEEKGEPRVVDIFDSSTIPTSIEIESTTKESTPQFTKHKSHHKKVERITTERNKTIPVRNTSNPCTTDIHPNGSDVLILNKVKYIDDKGNILAKLQYTNNDELLENYKEILVIECNKTIRADSKIGEVINMTKKEYLIDPKEYFEVENNETWSGDQLVDLAASNETIITETSIEDRLMILSDKTSKLDSHHEEEGKIKLVAKKPCNHTTIYKREDQQVYNETKCNDKHKCKHNHKDEDQGALQNITTPNSNIKISIKSLLGHYGKNNASAPTAGRVLTDITPILEQAVTVLKNITKEGALPVVKIQSSHKCNHTKNETSTSTKPPHQEETTGFDYYELNDLVDLLSEKTSWEIFEKDAVEAKKDKRSHDNSTLPKPQLNSTKLFPVSQNGTTTTTSTPLIKNSSLVAATFPAQQTLFKATKAGDVPQGSRDERDDKDKITIKETTKDSKSPPVIQEISDKIDNGTKKLRRFIMDQAEKTTTTPQNEVTKKLLKREDNSDNNRTSEPSMRINVTEKVSPEMFLQTLTKESTSIQNYLATFTPAHVNDAYNFMEATDKNMEMKKAAIRIPDDTLLRSRRRDIFNDTKKPIFTAAKQFEFIKNVSDLNGSVPADLEINFTQEPYPPRSVRNLLHTTQPPDSNNTDPNKSSDLANSKVYRAHVLRKRNPLLIKDGTNPKSIKDQLIESSPKTQFMSFRPTTHPPNYSATTPKRSFAMKRANKYHLKRSNTHLHDRNFTSI